jgi:hypothetical protein
MWVVNYFQKKSKLRWTHPLTQIRVAMWIIFGPDRNVYVIEEPFCCHTNRTGVGSSCSKQEKPDCSVWTEDGQELWKPKGKKLWILDLIYEKKKNLKTRVKVR